MFGPLAGCLLLRKHVPCQSVEVGDAHTRQVCVTGATWLCVTGATWLCVTGATWLCVTGAT